MEKKEPENLDKPTEITRDDIDSVMSILENSEISIRTCFKCGCDFIPSYDIEKCDECFFSQFPKEQVEAFCRTFFE